MIRTLVLLLALVAEPAPAQVTVADRDGSTTFEASPERVVTLDWALIEQVRDLGITPVGAPELGLYAEWVADPPLPEAVVDVGLRTEPNLERIAALEPDVILASDLDPAQVAQLNRIAPTLVFDAWAADHDNVAAARQNFETLAVLFDREDYARAELAAMETRLDEIAADLAARDLPTMATAIRLNDDATVWIYGKNSFPARALERLGFAAEFDLPASRWGVTQKPLDVLAQVENGALLAILPHMAGVTTMESPLWDALPAIRANRFAEVDTVWSYGGILSLERTAEAFHDALVTLAE
ncbi:Iron(III)-hydroxamate-binding protein FhuD [Jannaschia seosinensis]|uniref:Iron(III)-hydroxamate-binding protein FhuD n=1 Tax=Jannaschia seosinensis TaxID=313367 RepID=A0A0M7BDC2_9RHOB|nr:iron-siderophore ABC transporter substrate-binding protein [Jannaschia seosinensis]CUH39276.1 Iron(III)-hydroxamate-binding protein FhuD [Jannaschia seosinensis]